MEKEFEVCKSHKSLICEVDKGKFIRKIFGSKVFISIISTLFLLFISWCIWITNFTYIKASEQSSNQTIAQKASKDMDEVKGEMKEIRSEMKNQTEVIYKNQKDMLILLIEIQKEQGRVNGSKKDGGE